MSIEEKAKAYDEALERFKSFKEKYYTKSIYLGDILFDKTGEMQKDFEEIFPQLHESDDEKLRKRIEQLIRLNTSGAEKTRLLAYLEKQKEPEDKGEISDGYHTFNELYYYRMLYNASFFNELAYKSDNGHWDVDYGVHKSKRHHDGEECFGGGWFIVMANLPTGQISNHYELKYWDLFQIPEKEIADEWDGHTPQEAAERLHRYIHQQIQGTAHCQNPTEKSEYDFSEPKNVVAKINYAKTKEP